MRSGGDLRSDAQMGRTQLASLRPCVRKGRRREVKQIYQRRAVERFTTTVGQTENGLIGSKRRWWSVFEKKKEWARTILSYHHTAVGRILAIYLPKQPERVGHGGPSSKSVSNRPCARTVREGLLIAPNTNANGAQLYWLTIKDSHPPLLQIKGTVQRMSSAYTNCYKTPFSNQFSNNCLQFMKILWNWGFAWGFSHCLAVIWVLVEQY